MTCFLEGQSGKVEKGRMMGYVREDHVLGEAVTGLERHDCN